MTEMTLGPWAEGLRATEPAALVGPELMLGIRALANEVSAGVMAAAERALSLDAELGNVRPVEDPDELDSAAAALVGALSDGQRSQLLEALQSETTLAGAWRSHLPTVRLASEEGVLKQLGRVPLDQRLSGVVGTADNRPGQVAGVGARFLLEVAELVERVASRPRRLPSHIRRGAVEPLPPPPLPETASVAVDPEVLGLLASASTGPFAGAIDTIAGTGPFETLYQQLGGEDGPLGRPVGGLRYAPDHHNRLFTYREYENGLSAYTGGTRAAAIWGHIWEKWLSLGGAQNPWLGPPITTQRHAPDGAGSLAHFPGHTSHAFATICYSPTIGAFETHGAIASLWRSMGATEGPLGYPVSDEMSSREPPPFQRGRYSIFDGTGPGNAGIVWSKAYGAVALNNNQWDVWFNRHHGEVGCSGYPTLSTTGAMWGRALYTEGASYYGNEVSGKVTHYIREPFSVWFQLRTIEAVKTTSEITRDEIRVVAVTVDSYGSTKTNEDFFSSEYRKGTEAFPLRKAWFPLWDCPSPQGYPKVCLLQLTLSEQDGAQLDKFWQLTVEAVKSVLSWAIGQAGEAATAAGATTGVGILLGLALKAAVAAITAALKEGIGNDVVFEPIIVDHVVTAHLLPGWRAALDPVQTFPTDGEPNSWSDVLWEGSFDRKAGGGHYRVSLQIGQNRDNSWWGPVNGGPTVRSAVVQTF